MDSPRETQSLPSRRGRQIPPIKTQLTSEALKSHRPRPAKGHTSVHPAERVPLNAVKRQSSMKGFKTFFKSKRDPGNSQSLPVVEESQGGAECSTPVSAPPLSAKTHTTSKTEPTKSTPMAGSNSQPTKDKAQRNLSKLPKEKPPRAITSWDPPPLFKAYPQAVKHVSLLAPKLPSDTILRLNGRRGSNSTEESLPDGDEDAGESNKKQTKRDRKDSRRLSVSINKSEWNQKIFVLVTSGYLLQYTGDGHFDRLPEKMMQLNKDSVAFASDAIPGKHWVVQISQALQDEDIVAPEKPKGLFSRLGFQGSAARRATRSFLLVLENPEDMNSWLVVLRREIEALGGKKYAPETPINGKPGQQLQNKPSLKYLTKRDSLRTLNPRTEQNMKEAAVPPTPVINESKQPDQKNNGDVSAAKSVKRQSMPTRPSIEAPSLSTLATTTDLDKLRESSRFSYISTGTHTIPSSRGSSPGDSPCKSTFGVSRRPNLDPCAAFRGTATASSTVGPSTTGRQPLPSRSPAPTERKPQEPPSTASTQLASSPPTSSNGSPSTPNFSVPSFSKRFSMPTSSPKPISPSPDQIPRSHPQQICQSSSKGADSSSSSDSDNNQGRIERPSSKALSSDGDSLHPNLHNGAPEPTRTSSVLSNPSAAGRARPKKGQSREHSMRNYRSSHPPLATIALPELSPLIDEFPGPGTTRSRRGSFPSQNSKNTKPSPKPTRQSRHSARIQARPQSSSQSSPIPSPPSGQLSGTNKARSGSLYFCPQSLSNRSLVQGDPIPNGESTVQSQEAKRLSARKSLPDFPYGPPIAPPPDCPLPEVPPIVVSQFQLPRQGTHSTDKNTPRSRKDTSSRKSYPSEPRVQPKYDNILYNLDDEDSNSEDVNALNLF